VSENNYTLIHIEGEVYLDHEAANLRFEKAIPQSLNEQELVLNLVYNITEPSSIKLKHRIPRHTELVLSRDRYKTIRIRIPNGEQRVISLAGIFIITIPTTFSDQQQQLAQQPLIL
jgi:hypothetical protein